VPVKIDVIDLIINPAVGLGQIEAAAELGIKAVFIQPGAASSAILDAVRIPFVSDGGAMPALFLTTVRDYSARRRASKCIRAAF
jgi:hypothetical protein